MHTASDSTRIRPPAVASLFYPGSSDELRRTVRQLLRESLTEGDEPIPTENLEAGTTLRALIVPHAGYVYSGAVAASAYRHLQDCRDRISRVLLLGPAHRVWLQGVAVPTTEAFETPLGAIPLDTECLAELESTYPFVQGRDDTHAEEHGLEVQLPFLQEALSEFRLMPLVVGEVEAESLADLLEGFREDEHTLIVISTDLSHYLPYAAAQGRDARTAEMIESLDPQALTAEDACGAYPLRGLLNLAAHHRWDIRRQDLRNSGDTAGGRDRVVGYGAWTLGS